MRFYPFALSVLNELPDKESATLQHLLPYTFQDSQFPVPDRAPDDSDKSIWLIPEIPAYLQAQNEEQPTEDINLHQFPRPYPLIDINEMKTHFYFPPPNPEFTPGKTIEEYLRGRRLLLDELPFPIEEIYEHIRNGFVHYHPGLIRKGRALQCQRCGNEDKELFGSFQCFRCKKECPYCRNCIMMGRVAGCTPLFSWVPDKDVTLQESGPHSRFNLKWTGNLSPFQKKASQRLQDFLTAFLNGSNERDTFMIWAVCGAGKTEMLFHSIEMALKGGLNVLIATPRTDVVLELEPRFKAAFPKTALKALYGGGEDRFSQGELTISTTHQLLRYYKAFDLVIIDEVDAFPYTVDEKLRYAVWQAGKDRRTTVYVTATPDEKMKKQAAEGKIASVKVARRFHGQPLPVPVPVWAGQWSKQLEKNRLPRPLLRWLRTHLEANKQIFLFVPKVSMLASVEKIIIGQFDVDTESVHSADERRREKVTSFREGKTKILVTTTILERGVTVKGVQVAVFGADDDIFTESALVQIAGRAGRSPDEPDGSVVYFHHGKTQEMLKAIRHITDMNELGEKEVLYEGIKNRGEAEKNEPLDE
ncbi:DEAD/DEAH box helicase [Evansella sp. LMS18]|uniref:DEAD/DEAH box helicase n=1 Tax=Evansella sp. LMS18 TaxID=2924033 RepID=UPI0020D17A8C|nr:DEAD/DEAH box helicase [Evansella sp. LMS18]UTR11788.1 DEAD/DEAH box helicase [Evansella sp. LMS18]